MNKFIEQVKVFWKDEDGLSAVEYVVAGSLIVAGLATAFTSLGTKISEGVTKITNAISS
ncbi:Flp family type IVb pilin [Vibrio diazotrophicus]|uniref:Flp family type IVb pilin n=1 Tax=Vibrio diazotrophicus TaxID=685 RepID=UPI00142E4860|nr:Flp family type IVb pilin [Vibrio diazotrophicus]NIY91363.1 Flp family type IVb pilin [Vibrio diazotrophicus]